MFKCQECGRKFRTTKAAYRATLHGCPGCGGVDVDLDTEKSPALRLKVAARKVPAPQPHDGYHGEERDPMRPVLTGPYGLGDLRTCPDCGARHNSGSHVEGCCPACVGRRLLDL